MTPQEIDRLLDEHYQAEIAGDVEGTLSTLTDDVVHEVAGVVPEPLQGKEQVHDFYEELFGQIEHHSMTSVRRLYGEDFVVDESVVEGRAIGAPFGLRGDGRPIRFRLLHVFELRDGRIARENAWLDLRAIEGQLSP